MGRLLAQLFEITALFDMRLRPELVLLQKTMVTVEGVARRIDPDHDIWAAADPVVRRWIARELSPPAQAKRAVEDLLRVVRAVARKLETPEPTVVVEAPRRRTGTLAFVVGFALGGAALWLGWLLFLAN